MGASSWLAVTFSTNGYWILVADFNGDGAQDLALAMQTGVSIYYDGWPW